MSRNHNSFGIRRELAFRESDGLEVSLLWNQSSNRVFVVVRDRRADDLFELEVDPASALDAFEHPYAHASARGVAYRGRPVGGRAVALAPGAPSA